ncbi:PREDICTED: G protein-coupled receptor kinase 5-like isoform X2 [Cyprinodon variegatus]|uniref:G protein-coupled receptor kinase n=1 Tax=Cyprinodon variegatus TaxID=28743 RepID=A0A3Q2DE53_CYPVA|nr:PREDICTED: G protein-coupled receptor kinase 5-like isoform X2 [Cyprinodon variegatus]
MDIDNMVQNSALVRAREGGGSKGRSWKWREMLRFPHISECRELAKTIERNYDDLCVKQPIGKKLFQLYCMTRPELHNHMGLLDALEQFETKEDKERKSFGFSIIQRFMNPQAIQFVPLLAKYEQSCRESLELSPCEDVFHTCREALHEYLSQEPFTEYQFSMHFDRFLQWKKLERKPITKHTFREYRLLGKGGFGEVWACQVRATGKMYACKKLEKTHVKKWQGEHMALNEKELLEEVDSRFVVNLAYAYETKHALCLVLTMMSGGDLRFHIHNMGEPGLEKNRVYFYAAEVCCGLIHLHQKSIVYRDLKPENILLDDNGHIRISDLGLAVKLQDGDLVQGRVGTLYYMAPEVITKEKYDMSADWWGLGCLIYEMIEGRSPFRAPGERPKSSEMEKRITSKKLQFSDKFSREAVDICQGLLQRNPKYRLGCRGSGGREVKSHPFFRLINFRMLEAGQVKAPFTPDPRLVYCDDVQDIEEFSTLRGVVLNQTDSEFYAKFNTGSVPRSWQNELIETGCFEELNVFGPKGSRPADLDWSMAPESPKRGLLHRIFRRRHPSDSLEDVKQSQPSN